MENDTDTVGGEGIRAVPDSRPAIVMADADSWQSSWGVLAALKSSSPLVFHECSASDFRLLTRSRELLLPTDPSEDTVVVLYPDGRMSRASLP